jgi:hypothetical protein
VARLLEIRADEFKCYQTFIFKESFIQLINIKYSEMQNYCILLLLRALCMKDTK